MLVEQKIQDITSYQPLSEESKVSLGIDSNSFNNRMSKRLDKVRKLVHGNDEHTSQQNSLENIRN